MIESKPQFLNGVYSFVGAGYEKVAPVSVVTSDDQMATSMDIIGALTLADRLRT